MLKQSLHLIPARRDLYQAKLVFWAFLASLSMFFLAGLASYVLIRHQAFMPIQQTYVPLSIPLEFWISTVVLVLASYFLERSCWFVRRQQLVPFQKNLNYAVVMGLIFFVFQAKGMVDLVLQHFSAFDGSTKVYGICFTLAFLHALHVLGGMVFLGYVMINAQRQRYDHERHWAVNHCAGYWHFLDVVWVVMLVTFVVAG